MDRLHAAAGLLVPVLAAGGWLWWIWQHDRFEREPWRLVLGTLGLGSLTGLVALVLMHGVLEQGSTLVAAATETALHLAGVSLVMYLLPYRNPHWDEPFDGLVYGGAAGIGYGFVYTLPALAGDPTLGYRVAIFSMPVFMLTGIILGHYMSQIKFFGRKRRLALWVRALSVAGLLLFGIDLALAWGAEVVSGENLLAGLMAYASNMIAWVFATQAMERSRLASPFNPVQERIRLAPVRCRSCDSGYPEGAAFCTTCGRSVRHPQEAL